MPEIENFKDSVEHCFELASSSNFREEDVALEAFECKCKSKHIVDTLNPQPV